MTKYDLFLKKSAVVLISICLGSLLGCQASNQAKVADGSNGGSQLPPSQQEKTDLAPEYNEGQFSDKQWIEWKRTNLNTKQTECVRWKWTGVYEDAIEIESNVYRNCVVAPTRITEHILFHPANGSVILHEYRSEGYQPVKGTLKNVFAYIYGNPKQAKEKFFIVSEKIGEAKYPSFEFATNRGRIYLNQPGSAFHAVAIKFTELKDGNNWLYELHKSEPFIEALPKEEKP